MKKITKTIPTTSLNIAKEKLGSLKAIFPNCFNEGILDIEKLKVLCDELSVETLDNKNEKYGLSWAGKSKCFKNLRTSSTGTFARDGGGVDEEHTENIFIEGDNLEVLKLLQKSYFAKVKMIYIDPPYNTGKDFVYKDNFTDDIADYYEKSGQTKGGIKMTTNTEKNGRYHSDWLTMMYPRLYLARNLLRDDGVIFVSIDDNEVANLRLIMDEIYGEENFVAELIWSTKKAAQGMTTQNMIVANHEYILVYSKINSNFKFVGLTRSEETFSNPDNDERGLWKRQYLQRIGQGLPVRKIIDPKTKKEYTFETPYAQDKLEQWILENRILFPSDGVGYPARKEFLEEYENNQQLVTYLGLFPTKSTTEKLYNLFEGVKIFTNPKPLNLIKFLIEVVTVGSNELILDFFAGSGTTAHAVMELNAEDGGTRKYICVQLPEFIDENSEACNAGYKTISAITRERIIRAGKKIKVEQKEKLKAREVDIKSDREADRKSNIETDKKPIEKLDIGFKSFTLTKSNYRVWETMYSDPDSIDSIDTIDTIDTKSDELDKKVLRQAKLLVDFPLVDGYKEEDVVYEILLKEGFDLNSKVKKEGNYYIIEEKLKMALSWVQITDKAGVVDEIGIADKTGVVDVAGIADKAGVVEGMRRVYVTFEKKVTQEEIEKLSLTDSDTFICLDSVLTDTTKTSLYEAKFNKFILKVI